jgi:hypothetical protein
MPRDLTDLMERATSFAPPEPYDAADITRVAQRAQRRRTTGLVTGLAVVVIAAAAIGYGTTRSDERTPQPVAPLHDPLHQSVADAIPAAGAPGFSPLDYGVPSVASDLGPLQPIGEYADVDAQGRLLAMDGTESGGSTPQLAARYELVDGPGQTPHDVQTPPAPDLSSNIWQPSFTGNGGIAWQQANNATLEYLLTDAQGGQQILVRNDLSGVSGQTPGGIHPVRSIWYDGGRVWFSAVTGQNSATALKPRQKVSLFSLDPAHPSVLRAEKPADALEIALGGGEVVWLDGTMVRALDLSTGVERTVPVPMDPGCQLPNASLLVDGSFPGSLTTNGHLVSLIEVCSKSSHLLVTDLDGRLVSDIASSSPGILEQVRLSDNLLTFEGEGTDGSTPYVDDLTTGRLVRLGAGSATRLRGAPRAAGRYVLWYDGQGGHVGEFAE